MKLDTNLSGMILFILHMFGLWHYSKSKTSFNSYTFYSYALHFTFSLMYLMCMVLNFIYIDSIINATDALFPTLTVLAYCLKVVNFHLNADGMQSIFNDTMKFELKNDNEINLTNEKLRSVYRLSVCFIVAAHLTIILAFVRVLFTDPPELPLPCWYPLDWQNISLHYWIVYAYQMIGAFIILNVNATLDLYSIFLMAVIDKQMEILGDRLANITLRYDTTAHTTMDPDSNSAEHARITAELIDCIKVHQNLIR